ncbi:MAG: TrmH family RNA methyltransferase [Anaerolineae bacterium]|nr:TrmH family RNA methyltransferase [Anaerolineae bacterium]
MRLKKYDRDDPHGYSFGVFPTIEMLRHQAGRVREVLLHSSGERNAGIGQIRALCEPLGIPVRVDDKLVERLSAKENTYAVGVFEKYRSPLQAAATHVVIVEPADMGNLGTILRTLLAFGARDLGLIQPAVDCFDPRVVRASMGALFLVNVAYFETFGAYQAAFGGSGRRLYAFMSDGATALPDTQFDTPYTLIFGNESRGLPESFRQAGVSVAIPQSDAVDSLNLAVAVGIGLYAASR